jgi:abortive infection bacteriophage resistance protein
MRSWLHTLTYLRNLCAHHARLWNRRFTFTPKVADAYAMQLSKNSTFYAEAVILHVFMHVIADGSQWQRRLAELLKKHHKIDIWRMGFPLGWQQDSFWGMAR